MDVLSDYKDIERRASFLSILKNLQHKSGGAWVTITTDTRASEPQSNHFNMYHAYTILYSIS